MEHVMDALVKPNHSGQLTLVSSSNAFSVAVEKAVHSLVSFPPFLYQVTGSYIGIVKDIYTFSRSVI
jgi:hypothetical protein